MGSGRTTKANTAKFTFLMSKDSYDIYTSCLSFDFLTPFATVYYPVILLFLFSEKKMTLSIVLDELFTLQFKYSEIGSNGKYSWNADG